MFPFFILTRLLVNIAEIKSNPLDKFFCKTYRTPSGSLYIFFLSILSGYPMGAKLISAMYENGQIDSNQAKKMLSFCSVSGPMFIVGTVGVGILNSYKAGIIILICNIIASLLNGLIYRGKICNDKKQNYQQIKKDNLLSDSVYDSLQSILMVGGFIVLSFLAIDILKNLQILPVISNTISWVSHNKLSADMVESVLSGLIEMTRGIIDLNCTSITLASKTIIASALIGFGGVSIMMQSLSFLNKLKIPAKTMFLQKLTQGFICILITFLAVSILL